MTVIDAHCDAPSQMMRLRDYGADNDSAQVDFPKMKRGGVDASFFAAYVPASLSGRDATDYAFRLIDAAEEQVRRNEATAGFARCASGIERCKSAGRTAVILALENSSALAGDLGLLREFYRRGVRCVTLTHSRDNEACDSCTGRGLHGGLSPFGRELVREMSDIGMLTDVAHASDAAIADVLEVSRTPIAYTHGCCRALASHPRNIPDGLMKAIADRGGIVCMSIYPAFLSDDFVHILHESGLEKKMWVEDEFIADPSDPAKRAAWQAVQRELAALERPGVARVVDHIEHAAEVAGVEHVGLGTDYDGIELTASGLEDISRFGLLFEEMRRRGFSTREIGLIAGKNMLRVLKEVRKARVTKVL